jgi:CubicO group peptidase (beta-lactamase class C family)
MRTAFIIPLLITLAFPADVAADSPQVDERIARVEAGLLRPILLKGESRVTMSLQDRMGHYQVPGISIAVLDGGVLAWARSWGVVHEGKPGAVTRETLFQAGSISKMVAAMLTLRLASQGRVGVDDPVNTRLKSWTLPASDRGGPHAVTIRHLLTHSAGLTPVAYEGVAPASRVPATLELLQGKGAPGVAAVARVEAPGRRFSYSNSGYVVLEQLLAGVSGQSFDELARRELFAPLRMTGASFAPLLPPPLFERAAWGHEERKPVPSKGLVVPAAVGGLWTTPSDLARLLAAFFASYRVGTNGLIKPALAREAMRAQVGSQGLCGAVEGSGSALRLSQAGAMPGFNAVLVGYPELGRGAVVMINAGGRSGGLARELLRAVAAEYDWPGYLVEYEAAEVRSGAWGEVAGQYEFDNPAFPKIAVTVKDGRLYWVDRPMQPVVGGLFVVPAAGIEVEFVRDTEGTVVGADFREPGMRKIRIRRTGM